MPSVMCSRVGWTFVRSAINPERFDGNIPANIDKNLCLWNPVLIVFLIPQLREWILADKVRTLRGLRDFHFVDVQVLWQEFVLFW
jgi:hypothetical protein